MFPTERRARAIYRLFLHAAPGDLCCSQVVCFLWGCCLRNSPEGPSAGPALKVDSESEMLPCPANTELWPKHPVD